MSHGNKKAPFLIPNVVFVANAGFALVSNHFVFFRTLFNTAHPPLVACVCYCKTSWEPDIFAYRS